MKKIIAITSGEKNKLKPYIEAFTTPDTIPVLIPTFNLSEEEIENEETSNKLLNIAEKIADKLDALVLSGGEDINPINYGQDNIAATGCNNSRDKTEVALVNAFSKRNKPILGICRGHQILGLMYGLNYFAQDLTKVRELHNGNIAGLKDRKEPVHTVYVWGSYAEWLKKKGYKQNGNFMKMNVNSWHHEGFVFLPKSMGRIKENNLADFIENFTKDTDLEIILSTKAVIEGFRSITKPILSCQYHAESYPKSIFIKYFLEEYVLKNGPKNRSVETKK